MRCIITEGIINNISRSNKLNRIKDARLKRDILNKEVTPEGYTLKSIADKYNKEAQDIRKGNILTNQFKRTQKIGEKYKNDISNYMGQDGSNVIKKIIFDKYQIKEDTMIRIPIKKILIESNYSDELIKMVNDDQESFKAYNQLSNRGLTSLEAEGLKHSIQNHPEFKKLDVQSQHYVNNADPKNPKTTEFLPNKMYNLSAEDNKNNFIKHLQNNKY